MFFSSNNTFPKELNSHKARNGIILNEQQLIPTKGEACSIESVGYDLHKFEF